MDVDEAPPCAAAALADFKQLYDTSLSWAECEALARQALEPGCLLPRRREQLWGWLVSQTQRRHRLPYHQAGFWVLFGDVTAWTLAARGGARIPTSAISLFLTALKVPEQALPCLHAMHVAWVSYDRSVQLPFERLCELCRRCCEAVSAAAGTERLGSASRFLATVLASLQQLAQGQANRKKAFAMALSKVFIPLLGVDALTGDTQTELHSAVWETMAHVFFDPAHLEFYPLSYSVPPLPTTTKKAESAKAGKAASQKRKRVQSYPKKLFELLRQGAGEDPATVHRAVPRLLTAFLAATTAAYGLSKHSVQFGMFRELHAVVAGTATLDARTASDLAPGALDSLARLYCLVGQIHNEAEDHRSGGAQLAWLQDSAAVLLAWEAAPQPGLFACLEALNKTHWSCVGGNQSLLEQMWVLTWRCSEKGGDALSQAASAMSLSVLDSQTKLRRLDSLMQSLFAAASAWHQAGARQSLLDPRFQAEFARKVEALPGLSLELWGCFMGEIETSYLARIAAGNTEVRRTEQRKRRRVASGLDVYQRRCLDLLANLFGEVVSCTPLSQHNSSTYAELLSSAADRVLFPLVRHLAGAEGGSEGFDDLCATTLALATSIGEASWFCRRHYRGSLPHGQHTKPLRKLIKRLGTGATCRVRHALLRHQLMQARFATGLEDAARQRRLDKAVAGLLQVVGTSDQAHGAVWDGHASSIAQGTAATGAWSLIAEHLPLAVAIGLSEDTVGALAAAIAASVPGYSTAAARASGGIGHTVALTTAALVQSAAFFEVPGLFPRVVRLIFAAAARALEQCRQRVGAKAVQSPLVKECLLLATDSPLPAGSDGDVSRALDETHALMQCLGLFPLRQAAAAEIRFAVGTLFALGCQCVALAEKDNGQPIAPVITTILDALLAVSTSDGHLVYIACSESPFHSFAGWLLALQNLPSRDSQPRSYQVLVNATAQLVEAMLSAAAPSTPVALRWAAFADVGASVSDLLGSAAGRDVALCLAQRVFCGARALQAGMSAAPEGFEDASRALTALHRCLTELAASVSVAERGGAPFCSLLGSCAEALLHDPMALDGQARGVVRGKVFAAVASKTVPLGPCLCYLDADIAALGAGQDIPPEVFAGAFSLALFASYRGGEATGDGALAKALLTRLVTRASASQYGEVLRVVDSELQAGYAHAANPSSDGVALPRHVAAVELVATLLGSRPSSLRYRLLLSRMNSFFHPMGKAAEAMLQRGPGVRNRRWLLAALSLATQLLSATVNLRAPSVAPILHLLAVLSRRTGQPERGVEGGMGQNGASDLALLLAQADVLNVMVKRHSGAAIASIHVLQPLIMHLVARAMGLTVKSQEGFRLASQLSRLLVELSTNKSAVGKYVPYLVAEYIRLSQEVAMAPWLRAELVGGFYSLLDACGDNELAMLAANLDEVSRGLLRALHADYKQHHQFKGDF